MSFTTAFVISRSFVLFDTSFCDAFDDVLMWRCPFSFQEDHPQPLFHLFSVVSNKQNIFTTKYCIVCLSIIRRRDSNWWPSDYESPPLTTRPLVLRRRLLPLCLYAWVNPAGHRSVWLDWAFYWTLGNFSKSLATIYLPESPKFIGIF